MLAGTRQPMADEDSGRQGSRSRGASRCWTCGIGSPDLSAHQDRRNVEDGGMEGDTHAEQVSFVKKAAAKT